MAFPTRRQDTSRDPLNDARKLVGADPIDAQLGAVAAKLVEKIASTKNWEAPAPTKIPGTEQYHYLTAPRLIREPLRGPLAEQGQWAQGPDHERLVMVGWSSSHLGLSFYTDGNELVLSCGNGDISFIGYSRIHAGRVVWKELPGAHLNDAGDVLDGDNVIVASAADVGPQGISVHVAHNGNYNGYQTEYYHLRTTHDRVKGQEVETGTVLGHIGTKNEPKRLFLALTFSNGGTPTNVVCSSLIRNCFPEGTDSTNAPAELQQLNFGGTSGWKRLVAGTVSSFLLTTNRSTDMQNVNGDSVAATQAQHTAQVAQTLAQQRKLNLEASAKLQQAGLIVRDAMTYDFEKGLWMIGNVENGPH